MSLTFYKILHFLGIGIAIATAGGLTHAVQSGTDARRKLLAALHGTGMLLLLVAGFGALAKIGSPMGTWVIAKVVLWLVLGAYPVLLRKVPGFAAVAWYVLFALVPLGGALALYKP